MKKIFLFFAITVSSAVVFGQNEKYVKAMETNIAQLDSAMMNGNMAALSNNFERIGDAEKNQWLPYYYASYCTVMSSYMEKDKGKTDGIADKADELIKKAETIAGKENSETCVIKSMIASSHMMVDPQARWQQYGAASTANIEKAKALDPTNPRPVYLEGQAKFYTPESFGGGKAPAKELLTKALTMFDSFKPETKLHPNWGKATLQYFLAQTN